MTATAATPALAPREKPHGYLSPAYCFVVPIVMKAARKVGYAIGVHGSMNNDLDLIAVPWREDAVSAEELIEAIMRSCTAFYRRDEKGDFIDIDGFTVLEPFDVVDKPHGRRAWCIQLGYGARIDISVMPTRQAMELLPLVEGDKQPWAD